MAGCRSRWQVVEAGKSKARTATVCTSAVLNSQQPRIPLNSIALLTLAGKRRVTQRGPRILSLEGTGGTAVATRTGHHAHTAAKARWTAATSPEETETNPHTGKAIKTLQSTHKTTSTTRKIKFKKTQKTTITPKRQRPLLMKWEKKETETNPTQGKPHTH